MRRAFKYPNSKILTGHLNYIPGNGNNNKKIADILLTEQKQFCAYTDECITRTDARDIEHFNPTLRGTPADNYNNWFLVKHQWNSEKSNRWNKFQPVLHPTATDFEEKIIYVSGDYIATSLLDVEANNVIKLLHLDDAALAINRKKYINRKRVEIAAFNEGDISFFATLINEDPTRISYPRAIKEEFNVDIWQMLE